jgi:hypothetical protein
VGSFETKREKSHECTMVEGGLHFAASDRARTVAVLSHFEDTAGDAQPAGDSLNAHLDKT